MVPSNPIKCLLFHDKLNLMILKLKWVFIAAFLLSLVYFLMKLECRLPPTIIWGLLSLHSQVCFYNLKLPPILSGIMNSNSLNHEVKHKRQMKQMSMHTNLSLFYLKRKWQTFQKSCIYILLDTHVVYNFTNLLI